MYTLKIVFKQILYDFRDSSSLSTSYEVRVIDLDRPWESYMVTEDLSCISTLVWDRTGHRLLVTTVDGMCSVWEMEVIVLSYYMLMSGIICN